MPFVGNFRPSASGFHFPNTFPHLPLRTIPIPGSEGQASLAIGDASNGLCGGMVYAVRDYYEARLAPPADHVAPQSGAMFDYLVQRLFDSFHLPGGVLRYLYLMSPELPDHETAASRLRIAPHGRGWIMVEEEWPKIQDELDHGRLSPLGLIETKSNDPLHLSRNHQVLAYGYDLRGTDLVIHLYDPNAPDDDDVTLSLSLADPEQTVSVTCSTVPTVYCFFRTDYAVAGPPPFGTPQLP
jgi:hypothetical protein